MDTIYKIFFIILVCFFGLVNILEIDQECHDYTGQGGEIIKAVTGHNRLDNF